MVFLFVVFCYRQNKTKHEDKKDKTVVHRNDDLCYAEAFKGAARGARWNPVGGCKFTDGKPGQDIQAEGYPGGTE